MVYKFSRKFNPEINWSVLKKSFFKYYFNIILLESTVFKLKKKKNQYNITEIDVRF